MTYPENFLRGISSKDYVTADGTVTSAVFRFDDRHMKGEWVEQSICWEDDDSVTVLMLSQKKDDDEVQFKAGIARVPRACIGYINNLPASRNLLSYERMSLQGNPYHGNLLLRKDTSKVKRSIIAATIALHVSTLIAQ